MKDEEHKIQAALFNWLYFKHRDAYDHTFSIPNGGKRHISVAKKLKAEGGKAGVPDIFLAIPRKGLHGLFIELKSDKGRPTKEQLEWLDRLSGQSYGTMICKGLDAAMETIEDYLK